MSSMRFAVSLLTVLAIASVIGTVLKQNEPYNNYLNQFGQFWFPVFESLGAVLGVSRRLVHRHPEFSGCLYQSVHHSSGARHGEAT